MFFTTFTATKTAKNRHRLFSCTITLDIWFLWLTLRLGLEFTTYFWFNHTGTITRKKSYNVQLTLLKVV